MENLGYVTEWRSVDGNTEVVVVCLFQGKVYNRSKMLAGWEAPKASIDLAIKNMKDEIEEQIDIYAHEVLSMHSPFG